jgi:galactonate dehydratase
MKVTDIRTFLVYPQSHHAGMIGGKNWLFVKVETDEGIVGWGECYTQLDRDKAIEQHVHEIKRYVVDSDPFSIKHLTQSVYDDFCGRRGSMDLFSALSGIEQALWDVVGKALGQPVYRLLGGACRAKIRVYANGWYGGAKTPEQYADLAIATVQRGFSALKFDPFPGPWRLYVDRKVEQAAVANVRAVRAAVGPEVDLLIEVHRRLAPMHAIRVSHLLEEFHPFWFEEPVPVTNIAALAEVRRQTSIPVVTGETLYMKSDVVPVLEQRAADILNPDVCSCGGILELKEIAAMAEPYYVVMSPHNYNSTAVGLAATLQVAACIPNFLITEYFVNFAETAREVVDQPFEVHDSAIALPSRPGLGIELNEEALRERPYRQLPRRALPGYAQENP